MHELTISLDHQKNNPMYEQIYEYIREEIQNGKIPSGEKLPSTREFSRYLGVSRSTVDLAYAQLVAEGYVESVPWKGYFVCEMDITYQVFTKKEDYQPQEVKQEWLCDFALNGIHREGFPYQVWRKISKNILADDDGTLFQLGDPQGQQELRRELVKYLHYARGVNCKEEQILIGAGNDYLLLLLHIILGEGWKVAMDNPTYSSAYRVFMSVGYDVVGLEPDDMGMKPDKLENSGADIAYVMPSHQFPLGSVMPIKRRQQLLKWAGQKENRFLIEDDYDSEFRYKGKPIPSLQGFDTKDKVIYLGTFSKSLAPAIRISYMVLPLKILEWYRERAETFSVTVSRVDQKIMEIFLRDGYFQRHLNRMRGVYRGKHDCLLAEMKKLQDICTVYGENAGVHVLIEMKNGLSEEETIQRAEKVGIRIYGLSEFAIGFMETRKNPTILMGYATLSEDQIRQGIRKLNQVWRE